MALRKNKDKIEYQIKLLSDSNVVLVEANGYESEIFIPEIMNGRITFQNIIDERRCCTKCNIATQHKVSKAHCSAALAAANSRRRLALLTPSHKMWRMSAGSTGERRPLAMSTPTMRSSTHSTVGSRYYPRLCQTSNASSRTMPTPTQVLKNTRVHLDNVMQLTGHQLGSDPSSRRSGLTNSGYRLPLTPMLTWEDNEDDANHEYGNAQIAVIKQQQQQQNQSPQYSIFKSPKWRKCLTPLRTYSRQAATAQAKSHSKSAELIAHPKKLAPLQPVPTYLNNPTQGVRGMPTVAVRRRKLMIDPKTRISPSTFKQQQQLTASVKNLAHPKPASTPKASEVNNTTAFDMLTRANRSRCMSLKLQNQFKKNCVNKASATNPKYKILCTVPPLSKPTQFAVK